jgi:hypothetical protein
MEIADLPVSRSVGEVLWRQVPQSLGNVLKMRNADRENNSPSLHGLAVLKVNFESARHSLNIIDVSFFQIRNHPLPKSQAIGAKNFKRHGLAGIGVRNSALGAEPLQSQRALWVVKIRSKTV